MERGSFRLSITAEGQGPAREHLHLHSCVTIHFDSSRIWLSIIPGFLEKQYTKLFEAFSVHGYHSSPTIPSTQRSCFRWYKKLGFVREKHMWHS
jgi:hypothetical protein